MMLARLAICCSAIGCGTPPAPSIPPTAPSLDAAPRAVEDVQSESVLAARLDALVARLTTEHHERCPPVAASIEAQVAALAARAEVCADAPRPYAADDGLATARQVCAEFIADVEREPLAFEGCLEASDGSGNEQGKRQLRFMRAFDVLEAEASARLHDGERDAAARLLARGLRARVMLSRRGVGMTLLAVGLPRMTALLDTTRDAVGDATIRAVSTDLQAAERHLLSPQVHIEGELLQATRRARRDETRLAPIAWEACLALWDALERGDTVTAMAAAVADELRRREDEVNLLGRMTEPDPTKLTSRQRELMVLEAQKVVLGGMPQLLDLLEKAERAVHDTSSRW